MIPILDKIRRSGGSVVVLDDGRLRIEAPPGTLTDQDRQVLARHKQDLLRLFAPVEPVVVDPYLDQERQAIQWVETLSPEAAAVVVTTALQEWDKIVNANEYPGSPVSNDSADSTIDVPPPCGRCGGIEVWLDIPGNLHCKRCEPPSRRAAILRELAGRLREKHKAQPRTRTAA